MSDLPPQFDKVIEDAHLNLEELDRLHASLTALISQIHCQRRLLQALPSSIFRLFTNFEQAALHAIAETQDASLYYDANGQLQPCSVCGGLRTIWLSKHDRRCLACGLPCAMYAKAILDCSAGETPAEQTIPAQYKAVLAQYIVDSPTKYTDIDVFYKIGDEYHKVEYLDWHRQGTTWIGGTLDVGFAGDKEDVQIEPYSYLYVVDPDLCPHEWELCENGDLIEKVCKLCGKKM